MLSWRHGFARHNGYRLPPQFPGASSSPSIVHYLSGHSGKPRQCPLCQQEDLSQLVALRAGLGLAPLRSQENSRISPARSATKSNLSCPELSIATLTSRSLLDRFHYRHEVSRNRKTWLYAMLLGPCFETWPMSPRRTAETTRTL